MICFPTAKINIGLRITEKRADGYHNLETIFYPIGLKDALEIVPAPKGADYQLKITGTMPDTDQEDNLVSKAYRLMQRTYAVKPVTTYLHKAIPSGSGLGGGSSDAAYMMKLLADSHTSTITRQELETLASEIGADCSFFIHNQPVFATGIGNVFEPTTVSLKGLFLIVVKPDLIVSTVEAYRSVRPAQPDTSLNQLVKNPVTTWKDQIINDFEPYVFEKYPVIGHIKQQLYDKGAVYASMTGSGSAVYGLFEQPGDYHTDFPDCFYWSEML